MQRGVRYRASEETARAIGQRLREIREASGHGRTGFARLFGCSPQRWTNYEAGTRTPDMETMLWLHRSLGISLDWLIAGTGPKAVRGRGVLKFTKRVLQ